MSARPFNKSDLIIGEYKRKVSEIVEVISSRQDFCQYMKDNFETCKGCLRNFGYKNPLDRQSCLNCIEIGLLTSLLDGTPKMMEIISGKYKGDKFFFRTTINPRCNVFSVSEESNDRVNRLSKLENLDQCGLNSKPKAVKYYASDCWLNESIITWIIMSQIKDFTPVLPIEKSFICNNIGVQILQRKRINLIANTDDDSTLTEEEALTILRQLTIILTRLKKYQFIHGAATLDNICVDWDRKTTIGGTTFDFEIYLTGLHLSSLNFKNTRFLPSTSGRDVKLEQDFTSFLNSSNNIRSLSLPNNGKQVKIFKTSAVDTTLFTVIRYSGYPLYGGAIDVYSFMVSLLSWGPFNRAYTNSSRLQSIWTEMFFDPLDTPTIISEEKPIICSLKISRILADRYLYCNAVEKLSELVQ